MLCIRIRTLLQQYNDLRNAVRTSYRYGIYCNNMYQVPVITAAATCATATDAGDGALYWSYSIFTDAAPAPGAPAAALYC